MAGRLNKILVLLLGGYLLIFFSVAPRLAKALAGIPAGFDAGAAGLRWAENGGGTHLDHRSSEWLVAGQSLRQSAWRKYPAAVCCGVGCLLLSEENPRW